MEFYYFLILASNFSVTIKASLNNVDRRKSNNNVELIIAATLIEVSKKVLEI